MRRRFQSLLAVLFAGLILASTSVARANEASGKRLTFSGSAGFGRPFVLVTDIDDTIKVSHILDPIAKVVRFLSTPVSFAGMASLYNLLLIEADRAGLNAEFSVVSGTPNLLRGSVLRFVDDFGFPDPEIVFTRPLTASTLPYKIEKVGEILNRPDMRDAVVLLIGDDTEHDPAAYHRADHDIGGRAGFKSDIYIRRVKGGTRAVSTRQVFFDSAADIALLEHARGRLSRQSVLAVFDEVEYERDFERLFVPGEYCPGTSSPRMSEDVRVADVAPDLLQRLRGIEQRLRAHCVLSQEWLRQNSHKALSGISTDSALYHSLKGRDDLEMLREGELLHDGQTGDR